MPQDPRRPNPGAVPLAHPRAWAAAAPAMPGKARRPVGQAAPSASSTLVADPSDIVTRALAILAEENIKI
jgi:hypothetical protein